MNYTKEMEALVKQFETTSELANRDLSGWPRATREGVEMAKRGAARDLPHLRQKYSEVLNSSTKYVLVHGTDAEFSTFLNELEATGTKHFVGSTLSLYEFLSPRVEQNLGTNKEFNVHSLMMLQSEMVTLGKLLDKNYILEPKLDVVKVPKNHAELISVIRQAVMVNSSYGLMLEYVNMLYTDQALKAKHVADSTMFVLRCIDENEAADLSTYNSTTVDLADYTKPVKDETKKTKASKKKEL